MSSNVDDYAVVVGIGQYPALGQIEDASKDAEAFASWLLAENGGGLPAQNVHLLVSHDTAPSKPASAHPQQYEITRAFNYLGLPAGRRIGRRLYLFIRGLATKQDDNISILAADAQPNDLKGFSLNDTMNLLRQGGFFDELVILAELDLMAIALPRTSKPLAPFLSPPAERPKEVHIVVGHEGRPASFNADAAQPRASLAALWREAVNGQAADPTGRVTGQSIVDHIRQSRLGRRAALPVITSVEPQDIAFGDHAPKLLKGKLILELPHWMTTVSITNVLLQPVVELRPVKTKGPRDHIRFEVELAPGIYKVEAMLENHTEQQTAIVGPGAEVHLKAKSWKGLKATSAALGGTLTTKPAHIKYAEEWSRRLTWTPEPAASSRLFMFVRALEPSPGGDFASGLRLLDQHGDLVTDFSDSAERHVRAGFMAFNARLAPGSYVLCRDSRPGVQVRQQPLFLHANWETQVFLAAKIAKPSLRTMLIHMAPLDEGFDHRNETAIAVEAVLDVLRHEASPEILEREQIAHLLRHEHTNPWLGVLSASVLLREAHEPGQVGRRRELISEIKDIVDFLKMTIGDHPDVRALALDDSRPADQPFWHPPLLRSGLRLVQQHGALQRGTIPLDSLTDCILGNLVTNAPWTAWRALDRVPRYSERTEVRRDALKKTARKRTSPASVPITAILAQVLSPAAPIFRVGDNVSEPASEFEALRDATLIGTARGLMEKVDHEDVQTVTVDLSQFLADVSPEQVSRITGASIERAEAGLEQLRSASATADAGTTTVAYSGVTQAALAAAARAAAGPVSAVVGGGAGEGAAAGADEAAALRRAPITVEDIGAELRVSAARVASVNDPTRRQEVYRLTKRLEGAADQLLEAAYFVAVADSNDEVRFGNGALVSLISSGVDADMRKAVLQSWSDAIKSAPLGRSEIINPVPTPKPGSPALNPSLGAASVRNWVLNRTLVKDSTNGAVQGYVNILRPKTPKVLPPKTLPEIDSMLSELRLYSSLYTHEPEPGNTYLGRIDSLTDHIEALLSPVVV